MVLSRRIYEPHEDIRKANLQNEKTNLMDTVEKVDKQILFLAMKKVVLLNASTNPMKTI
jgi:hypothetical protein